MKPLIQVDLISDLVCPWCFIAEARFRQAVQQGASRWEVKVRYWPFELDPHTPAGGKNYLEFLSSWLESRSAVAKVQQQLESLGAGAGIRFNFSLLDQIPNTLQAHRLVLTGEALGVSAKLIWALFEAYFTDGQDLGSRELLQKIGVRCGLPSASLRQFLQGSEGISQIRALESQALDLGIRAVPAIILDGKTLLRGAQSQEVYYQSLDQVFRNRVP